MMTSTTVYAEPLGMEIGIAVTPKNFTRPSQKDMDGAAALAKDIGPHAVIIHQWSGTAVSEIAGLVAWQRSHGLQPMVGLSPTTLDRARAELDLPAKVRRRAGRWVSFANPVIREAFKRDAVKIARLRPAYLCLATEINLLALGNLREYLFFAGLYKEAYEAVKRLSPETKVFVSFQWDIFRFIDQQELASVKVREHTKVIDIFRPALDLVGVTTYPTEHYATPADLPQDYYSVLRNHLQPNDEVIVMEAGWPSEGKGTPGEQVEFVRRLPGLLKDLPVRVLAWALLHDVGLKEFDVNLNTVGLLTLDGQKKPAFEAFRDIGQKRA